MQQRALKMSGECKALAAQGAAELKDLHVARKTSPQALQPGHRLSCAQDTPESRRQAMQQRALKMSEERKALAAQEAAELEARHFAENCDLLRTKQVSLECCLHQLCMQDQLCTGQTACCCSH